VKIRPVPNISNLKEVPELIRFLQPFLNDVGEQINGGLLVHENLNVSFVDHTFAGAFVTEDVAHGLGRTPSGYIITKTVGPGIEIISTGSGVVDSNTISLYANSGGLKVTIMFF